LLATGSTRGMLQQTGQRFSDTSHTRPGVRREGPKEIAKA